MPMRLMSNVSLPSTTIEKSSLPDVSVTVSVMPGLAGSIDGVTDTL